MYQVASQLLLPRRRDHGGSFGLTGVHHGGHRARRMRGAPVHWHWHTRPATWEELHVLEVVLRLIDCLQRLCHCSAICAAAADGEPTSGQPARTRRACSAQLVLRCVVHVGCALHALRHPRIRRLEWCASTRGHSRPAPALDKGS